MKPVLFTLMAMFWPAMLASTVPSFVKPMLLEPRFPAPSIVLWLIRIGAEPSP